MKYEELDNQVRAALERREITPSDNAWEKLASRLDQEEQKQVNPFKVWWVAASVAGFLLVVSGWLFFQVNSPEAMPLAGEEVVPEVKLKQEAVIIPENTFVGEPLVVAEADAAPLADAGSPVKFVEKELQEDRNLASNPEFKVVEKTPELHSTKQVFADMAVSLAESDEEGYNKEVDALLEDALRSLEALNKESQRRVDAAALLADVEDELDRNFKDKALEALKKKISKLRSAVAERNE